MKENLEDKILDILYSDLKNILVSKTFTVEEGRKICSVISDHIEQLATLSENHRYEFYQGYREGVNKLFNILRSHKHDAVNHSLQPVVDWDDVEQEKEYCLSLGNQLEEMRKRC